MKWKYLYLIAIAVQFRWEIRYSIMQLIKKSNSEQSKKSGLFYTNLRHSKKITCVSSLVVPVFNWIADIRPPNWLKYFDSYYGCGTAIDRLSINWMSGLADKIKRYLCMDAPQGIKQNAWKKATLECYMQFWKYPGGSTPQNTLLTPHFTNHPSRQTRYAGHC